MKKKPVYIAALLVLGSSGYVIFSNLRSGSIEVGRQSEAEPLVSDVPVGNAPTSVVPLSVKALNELIPDVATLEKELKEESQPALQQFMKSFGEMLEEAVQSKENSQKLFPQLQACILNQKSQEIKQTCLIGARRLVDAFPESFSIQYEEIIKSFPRELNESGLQ